VSAPIADDWTVPEIGTLPPAIRPLADQWPDGAYAAEGAAFHQHWRGSGRRQVDWAARWAARVQERHGEVMRQAARGVAFTAPTAADPGKAAAVGMGHPCAEKRHEDDRSAALHTALADVLGETTWARWFSHSALIIGDDTLTVVAPSAFSQATIEAQHMAAVNKAAAALGWHFETVQCRMSGGKGKR